MRKSELKEIIKEIVIKELGGGGLPSDINYSLAEDLQLSLPLDKKFIKKISKPQYQKNNQWPVLIIVELVDGTKVRAYKYSRWRSHWLFEIDGKKYNTTWRDGTWMLSQYFKEKFFSELERLEQELNSHDWTYQFSDDYRYYSSGEAHKKRIMDLYNIVKKQGKGKEAIDLWKKLAPADFKKSPYWGKR